MELKKARRKLAEDNIRKLTESLNVSVEKYREALRRLGEISVKSEEAFEANLLTLRSRADRLYSDTMMIEIYKNRIKTTGPSEDRTHIVIPEGYSIKGDAKNGFEIHMPLLPRKMQTMTTNQSRLMGEIIAKMAAEYTLENGIPTPVFEKCRVRFEEKKGRDYPRKTVVDSDNLDTKQVLDGLGMILFRNDDALHLEYIVSASETDGASETVITVGPAENS